MAPYLHGRHAHRHQRQRHHSPRLPTTKPPHSPRKRPLHQARKMRISKTKNRIPRLRYRRWTSIDGPRKSERHYRLATPRNFATTSLVSRILQLLPSIHLEICRPFSTLERTSFKNYELELYIGKR